MTGIIQLKCVRGGWSAVAQKNDPTVGFGVNPGADRERIREFEIRAVRNQHPVSIASRTECSAEFAGIESNSIEQSAMVAVAAAVISIILRAPPGNQASAGN